MSLPRLFNAVKSGCCRAVVVERARQHVRAVKMPGRNTSRADAIVADVTVKELSGALYIECGCVRAGASTVAGVMFGKLQVGFMLPSMPDVTKLGPSPISPHLASSPVLLSLPATCPTSFGIVGYEENNVMHHTDLHAHKHVARGTQPHGVGRYSKIYEHGC